MKMQSKKIEYMLVKSIKIVPGRSILNYWREDMLIINDKYIDMNEHRAYWGSRIGKEAAFINTGSDGGYLWAKSPAHAVIN